MKSIQTLFIAIILFSLSTNSQITKGNWMVGGSGNLFNYKSESKSGGSTSLASGKGVSITPTIGHFIIDKLAFGLSPSYSYFETENTSGNN